VWVRIILGHRYPGSTELQNHNLLELQLKTA
jgi:hypothetical protein